MKQSLKNRWQLLLLAIPLILLPVLITNGYYMMLVNTVIVYIVAVVGLNYISGLTGENNLGMAGIFALGAYTSGLTTVRLGFSPILGALCGIIMGLIIGQVLGRPSLRVKGVYLALSTQVFGESIRIVINNAQGLTYGSTGVRGIPSFSLFGIQFNDAASTYYAYLVIMLIVIVISMRLVNGRWGRELKAIRDNCDGVESCGVNMSRTKVIAFTLCSVFGCLAGSMYAHLMGYLNPTNFNYDLMIKFVMILMLGGIGSIPGVIIGAIVVVIFPEMLRFLGDYYWLVFSTIMLVFLILRPYGLVSIVKEIKGKLTRVKSQ